LGLSATVVSFGKKLYSATQLLNGCIVYTAAEQPLANTVIPGKIAHQNTHSVVIILQFYARKYFICSAFT